MSAATSLRFAAEQARIRDLRRWVKTALPSLGLDGRQVDAIRDDVALVLTELGTNAVVHGCDGGRSDMTLTAALRYDAPNMLWVSVTDPGPGRPEYRPMSTDATCGRGLRLVMKIVARFGVEDLPEGGKTVWAEIKLPVPTRSAAALAEQVGPQIAVLRSDTAARKSQPSPAVGTLPGRRALDRIPA
ncbi:ATP-binding protein [Kitasatospora sp. NPDC057542]|uniref:ATP-binding protein n=1 Tax=Kitasatospora sp. NPDC057542 TaxID=3346162 RepID=UPI0036B740CB